MTLEQASEIQRRMYDFIVNYMKSEGMPPTNREIGHELNIASTGHVDYHLMVLEKKGLISLQPKKSRGIKLTRQHQGIPVLGYIAAGEPIDIFSNETHSIEATQTINDSENTYALIVRGQSMSEDHICNGDYVIIQPQTSYQNGDIIVAIRKTNSSVTLKRYFQETNEKRIRLQPANSEQAPILIPQTIWEREWQIQGKVIAVFRTIAEEESLTNNTSSPDHLDHVNNSTGGTPNETILRAMQTAIEKLDLLLIQKNASITNSEALSPQNNSKPEETKSSTDTECVTIVTNPDEAIVNAARKVVDLAAQQDAAYKNLTEAAANTHAHLNQIYNQGHSQANRWFQFGLIAATIGFLVILIGAMITIFSANISGILTSIASIIPATVAALFFQQAKEANKRLDDFYTSLVEVENINRAIEITFTADQELQDRYKGLIIYRLLGLQKQGQEIPILDLVTKRKEIHNTTVLKEVN